MKLFIFIILCLISSYSCNSIPPEIEETVMNVRAMINGARLYNTAISEQLKDKDIDIKDHYIYLAEATGIDLNLKSLNLVSKNSMVNLLSQYKIYINDENLSWLKVEYACQKILRSSEKEIIKNCTFLKLVLTILVKSEKLIFERTKKARYKESFVEGIDTNKNECYAFKIREKMLKLIDFFPIHSKFDKGINTVKYFLSEDDCIISIEYIEETDSHIFTSRKNSLFFDTSSIGISQEFKDLRAKLLKNMTSIFETIKTGSAKTTHSTLDFRTIAGAICLFDIYLWPILNADEEIEKLITIANSKYDISNIEKNLKKYNILNNRKNVNYKSIEKTRLKILDLLNKKSVEKIVDSIVQSSLIKDEEDSFDQAKIFSIKDEQEVNHFQEQKTDLEPKIIQEITINEEELEKIVKISVQNEILSQLHSKKIESDLKTTESIQKEKNDLSIEVPEWVKNLRCASQVDFYECVKGFRNDLKAEINNNPKKIEINFNYMNKPYWIFLDPPHGSQLKKAWPAWRHTMKKTLDEAGYYI